MEDTCWKDPLRFLDKNGKLIGIYDPTNHKCVDDLAKRMDEAYFSGKLSEMRYVANMIILVKRGHELTGPQQIRMKRINGKSVERLVSDRENGTFPARLMEDSGLGNK